MSMKPWEAVGMTQDEYESEMRELEGLYVSPEAFNPGSPENLAALDELREREALHYENLAEEMEKYAQEQDAYVPDLDFDVSDLNAGFEDFLDSTEQDNDAFLRSMSANAIEYATRELGVTGQKFNSFDHTHIETLESVIMDMEYINRDNHSNPKAFKEGGALLKGCAAHIGLDKDIADAIAKGDVDAFIEWHNTRYDFLKDYGFENYSAQVKMRGLGWTESLDEMVNQDALNEYLDIKNTYEVAISQHGEAYTEQRIATIMDLRRDGWQGNEDSLEPEEQEIRAYGALPHEIRQSARYTLEGARMQYERDSVAFAKRAFLAKDMIPDTIPTLRTLGAFKSYDPFNVETSTELANESKLQKSGVGLGGIDFSKAGKAVANSTPQKAVAKNVEQTKSVSEPVKRSETQLSLFDEMEDDSNDLER